MWRSVLYTSHSLAKSFCKNNQHDICCLFNPWRNLSVKMTSCGFMGLQGLDYFLVGSVSSCHHREASSWEKSLISYVEVCITCFFKPMNIVSKLLMPLPTTCLPLANQTSDSLSTCVLWRLVFTIGQFSQWRESTQESKLSFVEMFIIAWPRRMED